MRLDTDKQRLPAVSRSLRRAISGNRAGTYFPWGRKPALDGASVFLCDAPFIGWGILALLLMASAMNFQVFGKNLSGWAWVGAYAIAAAAATSSRLHPVSFPLAVWLPWAGTVVVYAFGPHAFSVQNAAQMLCPLVVGCVASMVRPTTEELRAFLKLMQAGALAFLGIILFLRLPMLLTGILPEVTGLAAEAIASLIFQSYFLCSFLLTQRRTDLWLYFACAAVPVVAVTRGPILGSFMLVVLCLAPIRFERRLFIALLASILALAVFYTPRVQRKMFWSGQGTVLDLLSSSDDLQESGRKFFRDLMLERLRARPGFGNGGNATWTMLKEAGLAIEQPHNDWLRIAYNYGYAGLGLFICTILVQLWHGWRAAERAPPEARILFYSGLSAFVPYAVLMYVDNVLIYAQFFGNLHFLLLGLAYGAVARQREAWASDHSFQKRRARRKMPVGPSDQGNPVESSHRS